MIRLSARHASARLASLAALVALSIAASHAAAQQQVPAAPAQAPSAPAPTGPPQFPAPDPANFTASSPTKETVNAFLQTSWGYDDTRVWQVQAILKTAVEGVTKVIVYVGDKSGKQKPFALPFFALADGKHIIAGDDMISFGAHPYADFRAQLEQRADGPFRNSPNKDLEIVEFADFQCPHCKEAQANMDKLVADFPKARIVFQNDPIASIHPAAATAAAFGVCVAKQGGSTAFFQYATAVFDGQDGLSTQDGAALTLNSAVTKVGLDPAKIATCAQDPQTKAQVMASVQLSADLGINSVPTLTVNGRQVSATLPYDTLKKIVEFQAKEDGVSLQ